MLKTTANLRIGRSFFVEMRVRILSKCDNKMIILV